MMIAAPFASIEEMKLLIREGADEFYCGVCTEDVSGVNDRLNNDRYNLKDMEELRKAVRIAHDNGKSVYITVNKPVLDLNLSAEQIRMASEASVDGVIVSSLPLLLMLKRENPGCDVHLSCISPVINSRSYGFFHRLGVSRICLPRHLSLEEIRGIRERVPDSRLQVFVLNGICPNIEGFCSLHGMNKTNARRACLDASLKHTLKLRLGAKEPSKSGIDAMLRRIKPPLKSCGLCGVHSLYDMGIESLKIEGRGAETYKKLNYVRALRMVLDMVKDGRSDAECKEEAERLVESFGEKCNKEFCYF